MSTHNWLKRIFSILLLASATMTQAALVDDLSEGPYVLMMRHADAPGYSDPSGFDLNNCKTQRNLGEVGIAQAKQIGVWLSEQRISDAQIHSSPWCRCKDTAQLLNIGIVQIEMSLGSFFENPKDGNAQTLSLQNKISKLIQVRPRKPIVMVTHQVNIQAFTGQSIGSGGIVLVRVNKDGKYLSHQQIR